MRVLLSSSHSYPAQRQIGFGVQPVPHPSGSAYSTFDLLAKGLVELGHEVVYLLENGANTNASDSGFEVVTDLVYDVDINHRMLDTPHNEFWKNREWTKPYVVSCHIHPKFSSSNWGSVQNNWVYPSKFLASCFNSNRYVFNGIDPNEYIYSEEKENYFLFMGSMNWGMQKGLEIALHLCERHNLHLLVLGGASTQEAISKVQNLCGSVNHVKYLGDIRGHQKAIYLKGARALIFPTLLDESFGLSMAEALMSGTPVICSDKGACPEIISPDVGFVCKNLKDYDAAIESINTILSYDCRSRAMNEFHYKIMAQRFVKEYQKEITRRE